MIETVHNSLEDLKIGPGDALLLVDVQNDFLPGGSLAVSQGDEILPVLNELILVFEEKGLPVFATRDWHPSDHSSFKDFGGIWPVHCVAHSEGGQFSPELRLSEKAVTISKATESDVDAYSGFSGTELKERLQALGVKRLFVGGLATDYCVLNTVKDGITNGFKVLLLEDAIRAVNVNPDDGEKAIQEMRELGAVPVQGKSVAKENKENAE